MSQAFKEKTLSTNPTEDVFSLQAEVLTGTTETKESETQVFSLEIPENESLEDFDKDMEQLTKDSINDWND